MGAWRTTAFSAAPCRALKILERRSLSWRNWGMRHVSTMLAYIISTIVVKTLSILLLALHGILPMRNPFVVQSIGRRNEPRGGARAFRRSISSVPPPLSLSSASRQLRIPSLPRRRDSSRWCEQREGRRSTMSKKERSMREEEKSKEHFSKLEV